MGREYFGTFVIFGLAVIVFVWGHFFEIPRVEAMKRRQAEKDAATAAPESHSKSAE
jgi:hypothetical protein